jgi:hypothetical protein
MPADSETVRIAFSGTVKTDLSSDRRGGSQMVAGDHLDLDAGLLTGADGGYRLRPRGIHHGLGTKKGQAIGHIGICDRLTGGRNNLAGKCQHPKPSCCHLLHFAVDACLIE